MNYLIEIVIRHVFDNEELDELFPTKHINRYFLLARLFMIRKASDFRLRTLSACCKGI
jgi:hypothetical protein